MSNSKLNHLLSSFSETDWKKYTDFAKSRYSNNSELYRIANFLKRNRHKPEILNSSNIELAQKVKSQQTTKAFGNTISYLCHHVEAFFVWQEVNSCTDTYQTLLISALAKKNIRPLFHKAVQKRTKNQDTKFNFWSKWNTLKINYHYYFNSMSSKIEEGEQVLRKSISDLSIFFESILHFHSIEVNNRITLTDENWNAEMKLIKAQEYTHRNAEIYNLLIDLKLKKDLSTFLALWDILKRQHLELAMEIRYTMLIHLISFASHMSKRNMRHEGPKNTDLYSWGIKHNVLLQNGSIPKRSFFNMVNFLSAEVDKSRMYEFVDDHAQKVDKKNLIEIQKISYALIEFHNHNTFETENLLRDVSFKDLEIAVMSKVLLLKASYLTQKDNYDYMDRQIANFHYFIKRRRNKFSEATILSLKNFAKYVQKLVDGEDPKVLLTQISKEEFLLGRLWLSMTLRKISD